MEIEFSKRKGSPRVNLGFFKPWSGDVFALGIFLTVEL